mgnify:FL=1
MITPNHKRIFCFGCSFTQYVYMPTWADILKHYYKDMKTVYNLGRSGAGNYYIFNNIVEKSLEYNFTKDDLILIQWSGVLREDRFNDGEWQVAGNILNQEIYSKEITKWLIDEEGMTKRDCSYVHAIQKMLEADNIDYEMFSMNGLIPVSQYEKENPDITNTFDFEHLYEDTISKLHPSMYEIMWGTEDIPIGAIKERYLKHGADYHLLPTEHLSYLEKVFQFKPSDELRTHVDKITKELLNDNA